MSKKRSNINDNDLLTLDELGTGSGNPFGENVTQKKEAASSSTEVVVTKNPEVEFKLKQEEIARVEKVVPVVKPEVKNTEQEEGQEAIHEWKGYNFPKIGLNEIDPLIEGVVQNNEK